MYTTATSIIAVYKPNKQKHRVIVIFTVSRFTVQDTV